MGDIVETVRQGLMKFEHDTACGLIAVETLAVQREVLVKLCDEIDRLREWVGLTGEEIWDVYKQVDSMQYMEFSRAIEAKLKEKNTCKTI